MSVRPKRVARLHYAASESDADMLYLTGFHAPDAFWFFDAGEPTVVLNDLEVDRARRELDGVRVVPWVEVCRKDREREKPSQAMARFLLGMRICRVEVPRHFGVGLARELEAAGLVVTVAKGAFVPEREVKRSREISLLKAAQKVAEAGLFRAREVLRDAKVRRDGVLTWCGKILTSEVLRAEVQVALSRLGAASSRLIVAGGEQACDPHEVGYGPLKSGEMIVVDIFPRVMATGYWGDVTRTFCVGTPRAEAARLFDTVLLAQKMALEKICDGCDGKKLQEEVKEFFVSRGYVTGVQDGRNCGFFHGLGHGVGLEIHEAPRIAAGKLRANQVITVEPGLYYPGLGGVRIEDLGAVTLEGFENFTHFPKSWRVR